jgi:hypothetical protein
MLYLTNPYCKGRDCREQSLPFVKKSGCNQIRQHLTKPYMKKNIVFLLFFYCLFQCACKDAGNAIVETLLRREADAFNKKGGKMVDDITRLDRIDVKAGRRLIYHYTIIKYSAEELDTNVVKKRMVPQILELVRKPALKYLRERDVIFCYSYYDKKGKYFFDIDVTPADYNKK